jgi:hypothetical protein
MKNFDVNDCAAKDKVAQDFINTVNPYRLKPSLGIDLRSLAKYAKENNKSIDMMSKDELLKFKMA